jgi:phage shock protein E
MTGAKFIAPSELERIMPMVEKGECILLDIRSAAEFRSGHIRYAKVIPLDELEKRAGEIEPGKGLVIYCRSGKRCMAALPLLNKNGREVMVLDGGVERWPNGLIRE